jgi:hypothetical protein
LHILLLQGFQPLFLWLQKRNLVEAAHHHPYLDTGEYLLYNRKT